MHTQEETVAEGEKEGVGEREGVGHDSKATPEQM
jgi:hypothetical protein